MEDTLVEFRAGKMQFVDKLLRADPRKGLIRLTQLDKPGTRVFLLKFNEEESRNLFFWAQEPDASQDEDYSAAVNNLLNADVQDMEADQPEPAAEPQPAEQLEATADAAATGSGEAGGAIRPDMLASILSNIMSGGAAQQQQQQHRRQQLIEAAGPSLGEVLKPEQIVPLLQSSDVLERLAPFLPEQQRSREALTEVVSSPQFRHQLALFSNALMSGELDLSQFGLQGQGFGVLEFLRAIQRQADAETQQQQQQSQPEGEQAKEAAQPEGHDQK
ncbi:hypothetical protein N2152v2_010633 [Parachlorella kessleri]